MDTNMSRMKLQTLIRQFTVILTTLVFMAYGGSDPCLPENHRNISHLGQRYQDNKANCESSGVQFRDYHLRRDWYYVGNDPMPVDPPDMCSCGTKFPIWMNGDLPALGDGIVSRKACQVFLTKNCVRQYGIRIKKCEHFYLYQLVPTSSIGADYCFGIHALTTGLQKKIALGGKCLNTSDCLGPNTECSNDTNICICSNGFYDTNVTETGNQSICEQGLQKKIALGGKCLNTSECLGPNTECSNDTNICICSNGFYDTNVTGSGSQSICEQVPVPPEHAHVEPFSITTHGFVLSYMYPGKASYLHVHLLYANMTVVKRLKQKLPSTELLIDGLASGTNYTVILYTSDGNNYNSSQLKLFVFTRPVVTTDLKNLSSLKKTVTRFTCEFRPTSPDTLYVVRWLIEKPERNYTIDKIQTKHLTTGVEELSLLDEDFEKNNIRLGFQIACAVGEYAFTTPDGATLSVYAQKLFAGVQVTETNVVMYRNETKTIGFIPTVPIGCVLNTNCTITMDLAIPVNNSCSGLSTHDCAVDIFSHRIGQEHNLTIQSTEDGQYNTLQETNYYLYLKVHTTLENSLWGNYSLPPVKVKLLPEQDLYWRGKRCDALNDPHMFTFDNRQYEHHENAADVYVLYKHTVYDVEIQHKLERCNTNAMCNCGVVVRAGRDVYVISVCNNTMEIGFRQCDDGIIVVKQESAKAYTIYLPYGTYVKARLDNTPYAYSDGIMVISLSVLPSVHDMHGKSLGLCGSLDSNPDNDFHDYNGDPVQERLTFINAWRVAAHQSLFTAPLSSLTKLWTHPVCTCRVKENEMDSNKLQCVLGTDNECTKGHRIDQHNCGTTIRQQLIGPTVNPTVPKQPSTLELNVNSFVRPQNNSSAMTVTAGEAKDYCKRYMDSTRTFNLCGHVPFTDTDRAIHTCVSDIKLTGKAEWSGISHQSMQDSCLAEIHRNKSVRTESEQHAHVVSSTVVPVHDTTSTPSSLDIPNTINQIIEEINEAACPHNCFERGICRNGICVCNEDFGADDCSIDFTKPPAIEGALDGGMCDAQTSLCTHAYISGGIFAGDKITCKITQFKVLSNKDRKVVGEYLTHGKSNSLIQVICPLQPYRVKRNVPSDTFTTHTGYTVLVSNDGNHFGNPTDVIVYNSKCQEFIKQNTRSEVFIKAGNCFIEEMCVVEGTIGPFQDLVCNPTVSIYTWSKQFNDVTKGPHPGVHVQIDHTSTSDSPASGLSSMVIILICISVVCLGFVIGLAVWIRKKFKRITKNTVDKNDGNPKEKEEEVYNSIDPYDIVGDNMAMQPISNNDYFTPQADYLSLNGEDYRGYIRRITTDQEYSVRGDTPRDDNGYINLNNGESTAVDSQNTYLKLQRQANANQDYCKLNTQSTSVQNKTHSVNYHGENYISPIFNEGFGRRNGPNVNAMESNHERPLPKLPAPSRFKN